MTPLKSTEDGESNGMTCSLRRLSEVWPWRSLNIRRPAGHGNSPKVVALWSPEPALFCCIALITLRAIMNEMFSSLFSAKLRWNGRLHRASESTCSKCRAEEIWLNWWHFSTVMWVLEVHWLGPFFSAMNIGQVMRTSRGHSINSSPGFCDRNGSLRVIPAPNQRLNFRAARKVLFSRIRYNDATNTGVVRVVSPGS